MRIELSEAEFVVLARGVGLPPRVSPNIMIRNKLQVTSSILNFFYLIQSFRR
jgi:hypothetical protein